MSDRKSWKDSQEGPQAACISQRCLGKKAVQDLLAPNQMKLRVFENLGGVAPAGIALGDPGGTFAAAECPLLRLPSWDSGSLVSGLWCHEHTFPFLSGFVS